MRSVMFAARSWAENVVSWGPDVANMYKLWYDRSDSWSSLMDNVHQQANFAWFQSCGAYLNTDMVTIGTGGMTQVSGNASLLEYSRSSHFCACGIAYSFYHSALSRTICSISDARRGSTALKSFFTLR